MDKMKAELSRKFQVYDEDILNRVISAGKIVTLKKGEYLASWHNPFHDIGLLMYGLFRGFVLGEDGIEQTDCFPRNYLDPLTVKPDLQTPMPVNYQALEDSALFVIPTELIFQLSQEAPAILRIVNDIMAKSLQEHWKMKQILYQLKGIDKYRWFLENHRDLADRVPLEHIASYLGITPVSLSRFRKQLREENNEI